MIQSTTTLIQATNKVLQTIGERQVTNFGSPVGFKCSEIIKDATVQLGYEHDWNFAQAIVPAVSWVNETAFLGEIDRVKAVKCADNFGNYRALTWVNAATFDNVAPTSYDDSNLGANGASYYTLQGYNSARVSPYPTGSQGKSRIMFYVTYALLPPQLTTDTFPFPERLMQLIYYKSSAAMSLQHLDDTQGAQAFMTMYTELLNQVRSRERNTPTDAVNMFRQVRRRRY